MGRFKRQESLATQAYELLKEAIITGNLKDGQPLPEEKMAREFGISRTPLRDAFKKLEAEGLIKAEAGRPCIVANFTKTDSSNFMELRSVLEIYNIETVISKVDTEFLQSLNQNLAGQMKAIKQNAYHDFIELDRKFHLLLAAQNDNSEFREINSRINTRVNRAFLILSSTVPSSAEEAYYEHLEIVSALEQRDARLARHKMIVHLNNVEKRFLQYYKDAHSNAK
ncbi:GntR family transcriptional regulator [Lentibacillus sp. CBA3610]|nr:GntR family transcriptional regulator [Lentibacillus sp. CBA3610]